MASQYTEEERKQRARDASRRYYLKHQEKSKARVKAWRDANQEKVKAYAKSDIARESQKRAVAKKLEHYQRYRADWEVANRERRQERRRELHALNPALSRLRTIRHLMKPGVREKIAHRVRVSKSRPEVRQRLAINKQNRRARLCGGRLSQGLAKKLLVLQRCRCIACLVDLNEAGYHLDHIYPLALGGEHADSNIQLLCPTCNRLKNAKDPIEWAQENGRLL